MRCSLLEVGDTDRAISHVYRASLLQPNNAETVSLLTEIQRRVSQQLPIMIQTMILYSYCVHCRFSVV